MSIIKSKKSEVLLNCSREKKKNKSRVIGDDLEWDYEDLPSTLDWTFNAFLDEYNRLYAFLNKMQQFKFFSSPLHPDSSSSSAKESVNSDDVDSNDNSDRVGVDVQKQLMVHKDRYEDFLERSKKAVRDFPYLREDISCRIELLSAKWDILHHLGSGNEIISRSKREEKGDQEKVMQISEIQSSANCLEISLQKMESRISPLEIRAKWTKKGIKEKKNDMKVFQDEVDSIGGVLRSLQQSCDKLVDGTNNTNVNDNNQVRELCGKLSQIEYKWHKVWLQSLEWQCYLDGLKWIKFTTANSSSNALKSPSTPRRNHEHLHTSGHHRYRKRTIHTDVGPRRKKFCTGFRQRSFSATALSATIMEISSKRRDSSVSTIPNCGAFFIQHHENQLSPKLDKHQNKGPHISSESSEFVQENGDSNGLLLSDHDELFSDNSNFDEIFDNVAMTSSIYFENGNLSSEDNTTGLGVNNNIYPKDTDTEETVDTKDLVSLADKMVRSQTFEEDNLDSGGSAGEDEMSCSETESSSCSHNVTLTMSSSVEMENCSHSTPMKKCSKSSSETNLSKSRRRSGKKKSSSNKDVSQDQDSKLDLLVKEAEEVEDKGPNGHKGKNRFNSKRFGYLLDPRSGTDMSENEMSDFWDQEKYLSEHNYDEAIDEASAHRLINFGDDYRNFIDSLSDGLSSPPDTRRVKRRSKKMKSSRDDDQDSMSDGDLDDTNEIIAKSEQKSEDIAKEVNAVLNQGFDGVGVSEKLKKCHSSCEDNVAFINLLLDSLGTNTNCIKRKKALREGKVLLQKWESLSSNITKLLQLCVKSNNLNGDIKSLELGIMDIEKECKLACKNSNLSEREQKIKASIVNLTSYKSDLFNINLGVHNLMAELQSMSTNSSMSTSISSKSCESVGTVSSSYINNNNNNDNDDDEDENDNKDDKNETLKQETDFQTAKNLDALQDSVVSLYAKWDDAYHRVNSKLLESEMMNSKIRALEEEAKVLVESLHSLGQKRRKQQQQQQRRSKQQQQQEGLPNGEKLKNPPGWFMKQEIDDDDDSGISSESFLTDSEAQEGKRIGKKLKSIIKTLEQENSGSQLECSQFIREALNNFKLQIPKSKKKQQFKLEPGDKDPQMEKNQTGGDSDKSRNFYPIQRSRIMRAAIPFQVLLILVWLFTWSMEPTCCDTTVNFGNSILTPQFQYLNGPPPI